MPCTNSPFFSIIVPAYNVEKYLPESVNSVLSQFCLDFELILVDDGSTDRTGEICDRYLLEFSDEHQKSRDEHNKNQPHTSIVSQNMKKVNSKIASPQLKVIHQPNSGLSAARNTGVAVASGEYLLFLDGDDYLEPNALATIKRALDVEKGITEDSPTARLESSCLPASAIDLLRFQAQEVFADGKIISYPETGFAATSGAQAFRKMLKYHYLENAWLYAYRRAFFVRYQFRYMEGCLAEDFGLTPLIIACAKKVKAIPDICYSYRQRSGSLMHGAAPVLRRTEDIANQLSKILPELAEIPGAAPVRHFLVASFLTSAAALSRADFLHFYHEAKQAGWLHYIHPGSLRAFPRAFLLRHFPSIFYRAYGHHDDPPELNSNQE